MRTTNERLQQRDEQIGKELEAARRIRGRTVTECAHAIGTSRRRYAAIEQGKVSVTAAELELLAHYLELPDDVLSYGLRLGARTQHVLMETEDGDVAELIIQLKRFGASNRAQ